MKRSLASLALAFFAVVFFSAAPLAYAGGASVSQAFNNTPSTFNQGDGADQISIAVGNTSATVALTSSLQVNGTLSAGITINTSSFFSGDWTCASGSGGSAFTCTRQTQLAANASDAILVPVSVAANAPTGANGLLTDTISGGGLPSVVSGTDQLTITAAPLTVSCAIATTGEVGVAFSSVPMIVSGGTTPYTYFVVGTLAPGLTLDASTGTLTGTPSATGSFSIQVTDANPVLSPTTCPVAIAPAASGNCSLGLANGYNLISLTGDISDSADITGRIAAAGQVLQATTIGSALRTSDPYLGFALGNGGPWAIVAGGGIPTSNAFNINAGGNVFSSTATNANFNFVNEAYAGSIYAGSSLLTGGPSPIDFPTLATNLQTLSGQLGAAAANGVVCSVDSTGSMIPGNGCPSNPIYFNANSQHYNPSWTVLYGTSAAINIFNITQDQFDGSNNLDIEVPTGSTVIINVPGTSNTLQSAVYFQGNTVTDANAGGILFNFAAASSVTINGQMDGTVLAPNAALSGISQMGGVFIAASIGSTGEVHYDPFNGSIPNEACSAAAAPLSMSCAAVTTGEVGVAFNSGPMTVSGGTAPYTYSIVGTLPTGLTLNTTTGGITGTPIASGTFGVQVADKNGATGTACPITINARLSVSCAAVTTGEVGMAFNSGPLTISGGTAPYTYSIVGTLPAGLTLNTTTGAITGTPTASGTFSVKVTDASGATATSCAITINPPLSVTCAAVTTGEVGVAFNSGPISIVGGTAPYTYSIIGTLPAGLTLNATTGAVTGTPTASGTFSVQVKDASGATGTACAITINARLSVTCAAVTIGEAGVAFNSGPMTISGGTAPYTYSIVGTLPAGLTLNTTTGAITGTPTASGTFSVQVKDASGATGTACAITINAALSVTCAAVTTGEAGVAFNSGPMTISGGTAPYTYSIVGTLPAGLTLNTTTGAITGTPTASGTFSVQVKDASGATGTACAITINAALSVTCAAVTTGEAGVAFNSGPMTISGGTAPYTYSIIGTLPAGLTLNATTGAITGTPTASGSFSVQVKDASGATGTACAITINAALSVTCAAVTTGEAGVAFNSGPMTIVGGTAPYTYSIIGTLPAGLTLNTTTGAITGTPTASGSFSVQVKDASGATGTACAITINAALSVTCAAVTTGEAGVAFNSGPMTIVGGTAPYTYSIIGTLPAGLTLNTTTGAITGTPTASGSFSVQVKDASGATSTACAITINAPLSVTCAAVTTGEAGVAFNSGPMTISGGTAPYTYSIVGTLPAGLTLNATTGAITGTPTASGTFSVQVKDASGATGTACAITINAALSVTCAAVTTGEAGVAFNSGPMTIVGGTAPYTYSIIGTLPAGLTLNTTTGAITGTPTASGSFSVQVKDASGATSTACAITINAPLSVTCAAVTTGEAGVAFNSGPMTISGGTAPYTYSIVGTLPAGLTLNATTGAITGTPTASGTFSVQVKDANSATGTSCAITINAPLSVTCAAVTAGEAGVAFNSGPMTILGGTAPYTYSIAGTLPAGLTLNTTTGAITGTPTASGTFSVQVKDANSATGTACSITISPATAALSVSCAAVTGEVGVPFNSSVMTVSGGTAPYSYSIVGTLPAGLTLSTQTGGITGTPTAAGTFSVKVKDTNGATSSACAITVNAGFPLKAGDTATIGYWHNNNGQALIDALNGGSSATNLANWLATNFPYLYGANSSNNLTGKTNADVAALFMTFFGASGQKTSAQVMAGALAVYVTNANLAGSTVAAGYGFNVSSTGTGAKTDNLSSDGTGAGLQNNAYYTVMQLLQQANQQTQQGSFNATAFNNIFSNINQTGDLSGGSSDLSVTCAATTSGQVGVAFNSGPIAVTGGSGSYTYSIIGTLPAGLTLNASNGTVSGTPSAPGAFSVQVTESTGATGIACPITIGAGYTLVVNPATITVVAGQSASTTFTFTPYGGYVGTVSFSCSGLPAGAACTFTPSSLTANGSNTVQTSSLTITTSASGTTTVGQNRNTSGLSLASILWFPGLLLGGFIAWRRRSFTARVRGMVLLVLVGTMLVGGAVGCGSVFYRTPLGAHVVTVVANTTVSSTASAGSSTTQTADFTLTITQ